MDRRILGVLFILSFFAWIGSAVWFFGHSRGGAETPSYLPVERHGKFEVRDYPALELIQTPLASAVGEKAMNESFRRLVSYLRRGNASSEKIPMTAPVLVNPGPAIEPNTSPFPYPAPASISIILPQVVVQAGAPAPQAEGVTLVPQPEGRFAVLRYSGSRDAVSEARAADRIGNWLQVHHWEAEASPIFAYYDPPWIPPVFRRNEVWVRVHSAAAPTP